MPTCTPHERPAGGVVSIHTPRYQIRSKVRVSGERGREGKGTLAMPKARHSGASIVGKWEAATAAEVASASGYSNASVAHDLFPDEPVEPPDCSSRQTRRRLRYHSYNVFTGEKVGREDALEIH